LRVLHLRYSWSCLATCPRAAAAADIQDREPAARSFRDEQLDVWVHGIQAILAARCPHQDGARAIVLDDRVTRVLFPVDEIRGPREAGCPVLPGAPGVRMVERVVVAAALDDLVKSHGGLVIWLWPQGDDRIVADIRPDFQILGCGEP